MNIELLQQLVQRPEEFKAEFKRVDKAISESAGPEGAWNWISLLIKDQFKIGRAPFVHQVTLPDGSQIRLKFYNTIKNILNSRGQIIQGREAYLSYVDVTVAPVGGKALFYTSEVKLYRWGSRKSEATTQHEAALNELKAFANRLGIDLSSPSTWCTIYTENY